MTPQELGLRFDSKLVRLKAYQRRKDIETRQVSIPNWFD